MQKMVSPGCTVWVPMMGAGGRGVKGTGVTVGRNSGRVGDGSGVELGSAVWVSVGGASVGVSVGGSRVGVWDGASVAGAVAGSLVMVSLAGTVGVAVGVAVGVGLAGRVADGRGL